MRKELHRRIEALYEKIMAFATPFLDEKLLIGSLQCPRDRDVMQVFAEQQPYILYHMRRRGYGSHKCAGRHHGDDGRLPCSADSSSSRVCDKPRRGDRL